MIPFPAEHEHGREVLHSPVELFHIGENGTVDLAEGVTVSDAVTQFWETLQGVVRESWSEHPLGREKARVQLLTDYLDHHCPGWREELVWTA